MSTPESAHEQLHRELLSHSLGMFRYSNWLGLSESQIPDSFQAGGTPIVRVLREKSPFSFDVVIKDEGRSCTHSICDRIASFAALLAKSGSYKGISAYSSSKMGAAIACAAVSLGLEAHYFIVKGTENINLERVRILGAEIHEMPEDLDFDHQIEEYHKKRAEMHLFDADGEEAKKGLATLAFETAEQLGEGNEDTVWGKLGSFVCPDFVVVEDQYHESIVSGFRMLEEKGIINRIPAIIHFDPSKTDESEIEGLRKGFETEEMAKASGILADPASAFGWRCLRSAELKGLIEPSHKVVMINTSNGLNDVDGVMESMKGVGITHIISSIEDVH